MSWYTPFSIFCIHVLTMSPQLCKFKFRQATPLSHLITGGHSRDGFITPAYSFVFVTNDATANSTNQESVCYFVSKFQNLCDFLPILL